MFNPITDILLWFFSQDAIWYFLFVPLMVIVFFIGLIRVTKGVISR